MRVTALQVLSDLASYKRLTHGVQLLHTEKTKTTVSLDNVHKFFNKSKAKLTCMILVGITHQSDVGTQNWLNLARTLPKKRKRTCSVLHGS